MKRILAILILGGAVGAVSGCGSDDDDDDFISVIDPWYIQYNNGHPIAVDSLNPIVRDKEDDLVDLINDHRVANGLGVLIHSNLSSDVARAHSIHMGLHDFVGEINPEGDDLATRYNRAGLDWVQLSENIATGWVDAIDVFNEWLGIPAAHANIDDATFTHLGVGYDLDFDSIDIRYWTADFREK